jgi:hypothetical protein
MLHGDLSLGYAYGYYGYISIFLRVLSFIYHLTLSYFVDHVITYLLITSLPGEVGLAEYVCTHLFVIVFLAADPDYVPVEFE